VPAPNVRLPGLLVSVRSPAEARAALLGGAALIDVKEPANGPLGRASDEMVRTVLTVVAGERPVSAARGELLEETGEPPPSGLTYVKWGLAGCAVDRSWHQRLVERESANPATVVAAYADWQCARAPCLDDVVAFACRRPGSVLLIDTHCKVPAPRTGRQPTLLDWLPRAAIVDLCARCRAANVRLALAGSLSPTEIRELTPACPDWFAVRGAACEGGRQGTVSASRVGELANLIHECYQRLPVAC
jgi:uncharacterized protein (UPF0264 family)